MHTLIIGFARNWATTAYKWNAVLDEYRGPQTGGCYTCTPLVTLNPATRALSLTEDYYALGHASKFVGSGAVRIGSDTIGNTALETVAFRNAWGSKVLIAFNGDVTSTTFKVLWNGQSLTATLPAGAAATYVWS